VLFPVVGDFVIDLSGVLVENLLRITVGADRTVHRLPDIELFAGARVSAERQFILIDDCVVASVRPR